MSEGTIRFDRLDNRLTPSTKQAVAEQYPRGRLSSTWCCKHSPVINGRYFRGTDGPCEFFRREGDDWVSVGRERSTQISEERHPS